ncbi:T9SS C-terminal target domain-containing protein [Hymenobacter lapidiphilus]|uniref:CotH kinase family protein n=1 Tax=Hymenobacter sp. CCM 8763 TaxID=2303334 RepID=UPI000E34096D|nr:CotH kinase family protein [Hymenobacter sp. CCM 8763]RFP66793.1 T9SS C-terminal target domain-containing protein [Hymenobacter sp. CCM 8763]
MIKTLTSLIFLVLSGLLAARPGQADTLTLAAAFYNVDVQKHLILLNKKPAELQIAAGEQNSHLNLDQTYTFTKPLGNLTTTTGYEAEYDGTRYAVYFTDLPILSITTRDSIRDAPSVAAQLTLVDGQGQMLTANLGIEYRGGFSQTYPKKSYELSFWQDSTGAKSRDVRLLNMRSDNKYNLQAMYNEPLRVRNMSSHALWQEIHQPTYLAQEPDAKSGIALQYVEVFVNGTYRGVYALTERIDRKQLKLKKYSKDITGELYKGDSWGPATVFSGLPDFDNGSETWGGFEYKHPEEKIDWTRLHDFVGFVRNSSEQEFLATYRQKFDLKNAVDYYLFLNLTRATDNTGKNLYIAKYKQGEPYFYVPWDLDGVFGTDWKADNINITNDLLSNGFYDRLWQDRSATGFRATLRARWTELRQTIITEEHIMGKFRANLDQLQRNAVYEREQLAWAGFEPAAMSTQLDYTATWLANRLRFLDATFGAPFGIVTTAPVAAAGRLTLYPNPSNDFITVETGAAGATELMLRDLTGRVVLQTTLHGPQPRLDVRQLPKGLYVATLHAGGQPAPRTARVVIN